MIERELITNYAQKGEGKYDFIIASFLVFDSCMISQLLSQNCLLLFLGLSPHDGGRVGWGGRGLQVNKLEHVWVVGSHVVCG